MQTAPRGQATVSFNMRPLRYDRREMIPVTAEQFRQASRLVRERLAAEGHADKLRALDSLDMDDSYRVILQFGMKSTHPEGLAELTGMNLETATRFHEQQLANFAFAVVGCEKIGVMANYLDEFTDIELFANANTHAHQRDTCIFHHRSNIGKINVDEAGQDDDVADTLNALSQHVIGGGECLLHRRSLIDNPQKSVVGNDNHGVNMLAQAVDAFFCEFAAPRSFEQERLGHNANRQDSLSARHLRNHWCATGAGSATHSRGHEDHVAAVQDFSDRLFAFFGRMLANLGITARAQALSRRFAQLQPSARLALFKRLRIGVESNKMDARNALLDHSVDGVATCAADSDYFDRGLHIKKINCGHVVLVLHAMYFHP